ncbi:hypothetical protein GE21DRAFT_1121141 [Neurospora crassa]|nr:hypothetical protein GE21DRAFT_1121141 [Neurospora crassa]
MLSRLDPSWRPLETLQAFRFPTTPTNILRSPFAPRFFNPLQPLVAGQLLIRVYLSSREFQVKQARMTCAAALLIDHQKDSERLSVVQEEILGIKSLRSMNYIASASVPYRGVLAQMPFSFVSLSLSFFFLFFFFSFFFFKCLQYTGSMAV